jgi:DNA-binding PadR family transcriptional regulator
MVPKGFLRYKVLNLLSLKSMSGSEIMSEIEVQTGGKWKPSPGSIYPLLAWLQDNGFVVEAEISEGIKRYSLSEKGRGLLSEMEKTWKTMNEKLSHLGSDFGFMGSSWRDLIASKSFERLHEPTANLTAALWRYHKKAIQLDSEDSSEEVKVALEEAARRINHIAERLEEKK